MRKIFTLFFFFTALIQTIAQPLKITHPHVAFWSKTEIAEIFENKWGIGTDVIFRSNSTYTNFQPFAKPHRFSFRPWAHYQPSKEIRLSISPIAYFWTDEYIANEGDLGRSPYHELRTTFQIVHHHKMMGEKFTHTFRHWYEVRYRNPFSVDDFFGFTRYRVRYRLRYLINKDYYSEKGLIYTYISNEVMVNYGQNIVFNMFSQNRIQLAAGYRINNATRIELRYMNRYRSRPVGNVFDNTHAIFFGLFVDQLSNLLKKDVRPVRYFD
jgi:hypothetical protein